MYIESAPGSSGFPQHHHGGWRHHRGSGGPGSGMMIQGDSGSNAAEGVEIMGPPSNSPLGPPAEGKSQLSPQELAQVQAQNARLIAMNTQQSQMEKKIAIGVGVFMVLGLGFVIYKATRD